MPELPVCSGQDVVRAFTRAGFQAVRQRGSHIIMVKTGHIASLSIPDHREVAKGTLRSLIRAAGLSVEDFIRLV